MRVAVLGRCVTVCQRRMTVWSDEDEGELVWLTGDEALITRHTPNRKQPQWTDYLGVISGDEFGSTAVSLQQVAPDLGHLPLGQGIFSRPAIPYSQVIKQAMEASPRGKLLLREIYEWFEAFHPYYTQENKGWKNSVRHTLSANRQFLRLPNEMDFNNKGSEWCLVESAVGQAFLKHRNEIKAMTMPPKTPSPGPLSMWPRPVGDHTSAVEQDEMGPLRRTKSSDVYWSGATVRTNETPAHLLGMTPNPDFTLDLQQPSDRRHIRSLSVGDTPMRHHSPLQSPPPLDHLEDLSLCNIDDIMHGI